MYNFIKKSNQKQLNRLNPSYIGSARGVQFYECPVYGDETDMIVKAAGIWYDCDIMELEDAGEELDWIASKMANGE